MDKRLIAYLASLSADPMALIGWNIHIAQRDGEDVGFCLSKGPEVHILPLVERRAISRRNILEFLNPLIAEFGYVTTRVPISETDHRLRTSLGFEPTWQDKNFSYFALTKLKYARTQQGEPTCQ